jgi:hypothetical protein
MAAERRGVEKSKSRSSHADWNPSAPKAATACRLRIASLACRIANQFQSYFINSKFYPPPFTQFSFDFERQLTTSDTVEVSFTGSRGYEKTNQPQTQEAMQTACLAYRMTGRDDFASDIKAGLQKIDQKADFSDAELLKRDPPWHSGLATGATRDANRRRHASYDSCA